MTVGASKAATTITHKPPLAPSPQSRPAPTARALPPKPAAQRGPFWMPIRGPDPTPIDNRLLNGLGHACLHADCVGLGLFVGAARIASAPLSPRMMFGLGAKVVTTADNV